MNEPLISRKYLADLLGVGLVDLYRKVQKYAADLPKSGNKLPLSVARKITQEYIVKNHKATKQVQCFFNFKGGTGKTTLTYNIAALFYLMGYKVLAIDCDPQGHLTKSLLEDENMEHQGIFEVMSSNVPIESTVIEIMPEFGVIPSNVKLSFIDSQLANRVRREELLRQTMQPLKDQFDFIFVDVNPSLSILNRNVIVASDFVNIVSEAQPFSSAGMEMLLQEFHQLAQVSQDSVIPYNIIVNKFEPNLLSNLNIISKLKNTEELSEKICENIIRKCDDFNFSANHKIPVAFFTNRNKSNAKNDIVGLGKELLNMSTVFVDHKKERMSHAA